MDLLGKILYSVCILLLTQICAGDLDVVDVSYPMSERLVMRSNIYLGLYSGNGSATLRVLDKPRDTLQCYKFIKWNSTTEQCKFYGDCCVDPMRIRDRLEPGTFSCQTTPGYTGELVYVVDKCPRLTEDKKLTASCEQTNKASNFSMEAWPVTSRRTGVLYRNIFCAICHGVLAESNVTLANTEYTQSVEFWWLSVSCDQETISKLTDGLNDDSFSMEKLEPFITNGKCGSRFSPPSQPHRCLDAVRSCPDNYTDIELKLLCEQGPVSYTEGADSRTYRNYFCQLCHGSRLTTETTSYTTDYELIDCGPVAHTGMNGTLTSPNYPDNYPNNAYCNWTFTMPPGEIVGIRLNNFELEEHRDCDYDSLTFYDLTTGEYLDKLCGSGVRYVEGNSSSVRVVFRTDRSTAFSGFNLEWAALSCEFMGNRCSDGGGCDIGSYERPDLPCAGGTEESCCAVDGLDLNPTSESRPFTTEDEPIDCGPGAHVGMNGSFTSPNYPNNYPNNAFCNWTITMAPEEIVGIRLDNFMLEEHWRCAYDSLTFYDHTTGEYLDKLCGSGVRYVEGNSSSVLVVFRTDMSTALSGFNLEWAALSCEFMGNRCSDSGCDIGSYERPDLPCAGGTKKSCCSVDEPTDCGPGAHAGMNGSFTSPNYPNNYPNNANCNWTITMPPGEIVGIRLDNFELEEHRDCDYDSLAFYDLTTGEYLDKLCGSGVRYVEGNSSSVLVDFRSDMSTALSGFNLKWAALSCEFMGNRCSDSGCDIGSYERPDLPCAGGTKESCCAVDEVIDCGPVAHTGMNGFLTSPNYPNNYPNNAFCNWTITMPPGEIVGIRLNNFELEDDPNCDSYDSLKFYDLTTGAHLATHCGSGMRYVEGNSSSVLVVFRTDATSTRSGFDLEWAALTCELMGNKCSGSGCDFGSYERPDLPCDGGTRVRCCEVNAQTCESAGYKCLKSPCECGETSIISLDCKEPGDVCCRMADETKIDVPHSETTDNIQEQVENFKWPYPLMYIQPKLQTNNHQSLSSKDYLVNTNLYDSCGLRLALTNSISEGYDYRFKPFNPPTNSSWDFGSLLCESSYGGVCDKLISRPMTGCAGPGCGVNSWQDTKTNCYDSTDFTYNASVREQAEYIWPHSLYGRYYSSCKQALYTYVDAWKVNCRCDSRCHYFDECCFDTPLPENFIQPHEPLKYSCVGPQQCQEQFHQDRFIPKYHVAIISACPTGSDMGLTHLCNQGEIGDWSPVGWTVYDTHTNLSYKNVYCALCHHDVTPDRVNFWQAYFNCPQHMTQKTNFTGEDDMYSLEWQLGECSFIRFIPRASDILYTCSNTPIVSTCPQYLAHWKIADDCINKPVSLVTNSGTMYRNAYCAICNLNDRIMSSDVYSSAAFNFGAAALYSDEVSYRPYGSLILDVSENLCCYGNECTQNMNSFSEQSTWAQIRLGNSSEQLTRLPFSTSWNDENSNKQNDNMISINFLCSGSFDPSPVPLQNCPDRGSDGFGPGPGPQTPSFSKLMFSNFEDIPSTQTLKHDTNWKEVDDSLLMCSNGTNLDQVSGVHFFTLRLSPSLIEVKQQKIVNLMTEISLEVYDYILISLSLLSLSMYIIYILIKKKRRELNTPELLKLSVLISLFGALLCFSVANIPAGRYMIGCQALAALLQFLFLSTLTWTSAMGISIAHIIFTMQPPSNTARRYVFFAAYALGLPMVLVMTTFALSAHQERIEQFESPVYREAGFCFIHETYVMISLFLAPIYVIVTSNVILCIACIVKVGKATVVSAQDKDRGKKNTITCIKLSVCFGVGWILALFLPIFEETEGVFVAFQVFVEIQGLLVVATNLISWKCIRDKQKRFALITSTNSSGSKSLELSSYQSDTTPRASAI